MGAIVIHACLIQTAKVTSRWFFLSYGLLVSAALFDFSFVPSADWRFYVVVWFSHVFLKPRPKVSKVQRFQRFKGSKAQRFKGF